jgi:hypothetical protein
MDAFIHDTPDTFFAKLGQSLSAMWGFASNYIPLLFKRNKEPPRGSSITAAPPPKPQSYPRQFKNSKKRKE